MKKSFVTYAIVMSSVLAVQGGTVPKECEAMPLKSNDVKPIIAEVKPLSLLAAANTNSKNVIKKYKNGVFKIQTPLDSEKYYTKVKLSVKKGKIATVDWTIYDAGHSDKAFNKEYYKVMEPYGDLYVKQAKDDWAGSRNYAKELIKTQNIDKVDTVAGATWTYNKFKEAVEMALLVAKGK